MAVPLVAVNVAGWERAGLMPLRGRHVRVLIEGCQSLNFGSEPGLSIVADLRALRLPDSSMDCRDRPLALEPEAR